MEECNMYRMMTGQGEGRRWQAMGCYMRPLAVVVEIKLSVGWPWTP